MSLIKDFRYRPEIDGLRAIAVLAVLFYHAELGLSGGFIGVDVFFVVSGFLITSLIVKDLQEGKFTLSGFWERRARRILPALVTVVMATLAAGWFLMLTGDYRALGVSASYQAAFAANIYFWKEIGYFAGPAEEMPLLHTWSLAVEEQYYFIVPLALLVLFRFGIFRRRPVLLAIISGGIAVSLLCSMYGVRPHPSATFYLLPTRAWELLFGSLVALMPLAKLSGFWREVLSWGGLVCVMLPCILYDHTTPFPGLAAVPPCLGTALFIWSGHSGIPGQRLPTAARILAMPAIVFIGLISYSLYLWHWPMFAFSKYVLFGSLSISYRIGLVVFAMVLATITWRLVETPFRRRTVCSSKRSMLAFGAMAVISVFIAGTLIVENEGFRQRIPSSAIVAADAQASREFIHTLDASHVKSDRLICVGSKDPSARIWGLVWGDSHAMAAMPALDLFMQVHGYAGRQATHSEMAPLVGYYLRDGYGLRREAMTMSESVIDYIKAHKIPNVFLIAAWSGYSGPEKRGNIEVESALLDTITRIVEAGAQPWIMLEIPRQRVDIPKLLCLSRWWHFAYSPFLAGLSTFNGLHGKDRALLDRVTAAGGKLIDPRPLFIDESQTRYVVEKDGVILYRDSHHLTAEGAKLVLTPLLERVVGTLASERVDHGGEPSDASERMDHVVRHASPATF